ncbi:MAG: hypothetical protein WBL88_09830, partial [Nitrososphaeraceae archaeon]
LLRRTRVSIIVTSGLLRVFAESYGYLEHYFINDPLIGKTVNLPVKGRTHRLATPIIGGLYSYHIYPVMVIFFLVGFGPFFDSISFNIVGRHERRRAASLGVANVISAMMVEDFSWFYYRWLLCCMNLIFVNFILNLDRNSVFPCLEIVVVDTKTIFERRILESCNKA